MQTVSDTRTVLTAFDELLQQAWARMRDDLCLGLREQWQAVEAARAAEMYAVREERQRELAAAMRAFDDETAARQARTDSEIDALRAETERAEQARAGAEDALESMRQRLEAAADAAHQPPSLGDLVLAMRELQQVRSLGEVLDTLTRAARRTVARAAVYIVRGDCLQEWNMTGPSDASGARTCLWPADTPQWFDDDRGTFPIRVGGAVVAVLSVEPVAADAEAHPSWVDALALLTGHASLVLETLTLRRRARLDRRTDVYQPIGHLAPAGEPR